jgi:hypothetical protein
MLLFGPHASAAILPAARGCHLLRCQVVLYSLQVLDETDSIILFIVVQERAFFVELSARRGDQICRDPAPHAFKALQHALIERCVFAETAR